MRILYEFPLLLTPFPTLRLRSCPKVSKGPSIGLVFQPHITFFHTKPRILQLPFYDLVEDAFDRWTGRNPQGGTHRLALYDL